MPYVQKKKMDKGGLLFAAAVFLMVVVLFIQSIPVGGKFCIDIAIVLIFLFIRRGYIYYQKGVQAYKSADYPLAFAYLRKAVKSGVGDEQKVNIGSAFIQKGSVSFGEEVLTGLISKADRNSQTGNSARIALSAGYYAEGKTDEAIALLNEVKDGGYTDSNWYTNMSSFLMAKEDYKGAKAVLNEAKKKEVKALGVLDNLGWLYIVNGDFAKAKAIYEDVVDDRQAGFPEAYIHYAQVHAHFNETEECSNCLSWACSKTFMNTCPFTKEYAEKLLDMSEEREDFCLWMEAHRIEIAGGKEVEN